MLTRSEMCVLCVKYYSFLGLLHCPTWLQLTRRKHSWCVWEWAEKAGAFLVNENWKWQTSGMWWDLNTGYQGSSNSEIWKQLANRVYSHKRNPRGSSYKGMDWRHLKNHRKYRMMLFTGIRMTQGWTDWPGLGLGITGYIQGSPIAHSSYSLRIVVLSVFVKFIAIFHREHPVTIFNFCTPEIPKFNCLHTCRWQQQLLASLIDKWSFANLAMTQTWHYTLMTHIQ